MNRKPYLGELIPSRITFFVSLCNFNLLIKNDVIETWRLDFDVFTSFKNNPLSLVLANDLTIRIFSLLKSMSSHFRPNASPFRRPVNINNSKIGSRSLISKKSKNCFVCSFVQGLTSFEVTKGGVASRAGLIFSLLLINNSNFWEESLYVLNTTVGSVEG